MGGAAKGAATVTPTVLDKKLRMLMSNIVGNLFKLVDGTSSGNSFSKMCCALDKHFIEFVIIGIRLNTCLNRIGVEFQGCGDFFELSRCVQRV